MKEIVCVDVKMLWSYFLMIFKINKALAMGPLALGISMAIKASNYINHDVTT